MSAPIDPVQASFDQAIREFKRSLLDKNAWAEILKTKSIDDVYDLTDKLQREQAKTNTMRGLAKIEPFLKGLTGYAGVIEVFTQAKPDVLALIWGPIKLLIHWASTLKQSFDAILSITAEIGQVLPEFQTMSRLFGHNQQIRDILLLFFKDILDFYTIALNFFSISRWKFLFEIVWPKHKDKIKLVMVHIERHTSLFRDQVRLEHIQEEHNARVKSFQHFEETEKANMRQEYHAIKSEVSPKLYGYTLDRVRGRVCEGTGAWIVDYQAYKEWLDTSNQSNRVLWIQGIPGAGKTYLSSIIIDQAASLGSTTYAFLTHNLRSDVTALHVIHTLIFELVSQNESLQEAVCKLSRKELKSSAEAAIDILKQLIVFAGATYVVIDGLDEIDEIERNRLLSYLLRLTKECDEARLVISSRAESDISKMLQGKAMIRVDTENDASVHRFVDQRSNEWLTLRNFDIDIKLQIKALLMPLASKAKGMFLYAKIVLQSIALLDDPDDIRRELNVLPENLDDAYARVVKRIDDLKPAVLVKKAYKLLGLIVCSPTPFQIHELEQMLKIEPYDIDGESHVSASVDIVAICGPIVEVVDDYVQLVHFTVQEYLTSSHVVSPINRTQAIFDLTACCITYLCQKHHNPVLDDEDIRGNIISGKYRLHFYACTMWYLLLQQCVRANLEQQQLGSLRDLVEILALRRRNHAFEDAIEADLPIGLELAFQGRETAKNLLKAATRLAETCNNEDFSRARADEWKPHDPTTLFETSCRVYALMKETLCTSQQHRDDCHCFAMTRHYGRGLHKCATITCRYARQGFENFQQCTIHEKTHTKSWTCDFPGCRSAIYGFTSRKIRDDHYTSSHETKKDERSQDTLLVNTPCLVDFIYDLIENDDHGTLQQLLPQIANANVLPRAPRLKLSKYALDLKRFDCFLILTPYRFSTDGFHAAIICRRPTSFESYLSQYRQQELDQVYQGVGKQVPKIETHLHLLCVSSLVSAGSDELWEIWNQCYKSIRYVKSDQVHSMSIYASKSVIQATQNDPTKEDVLMKWWEIIKLARKSIVPRELEMIIARIVQTTCSTRLASKVVELAGDTKFSFDKRSNRASRTPLHNAARKTSAEAAEMMKFLLFKGADPDGSSQGIGQEPGAANIHKWLGITWDELVAQAKAEVSRGTPQYFGSSQTP